MSKNLVIILSGGTGRRVANDLPKQFLTLKGKSILAHTIESFESHPGVHHIFIVSHGEYLDRTGNIVREGRYKKVVRILKGGVQRQDSSRLGVAAANPGEYENVLIHDAARPFVGHELLDRILEGLTENEAINVAIPSSDTVIKIDEDHFVESVPDRKYIRRVQTPQAFKTELIREAHRLAREKGITDATDDCSLVLKLGLSNVYVVEGSVLNIKITYPFDLCLAEKMLELED